MTKPRTRRTPSPQRGLAARARRLLEGILERLARAGYTCALGPDGTTTVRHGDRQVARFAPGEDAFVADVDASAAPGDPLALRRLGAPHSDAEAAQAGRRIVVVRTRREATHLLDALRPAREGGGPKGGTWAVLRARRDTGLRVRRLDVPPRDDDGTRVLVDRRWPVGFRRADARVDVWMPDIAPSAVLVRAYGPAPAPREVFRRAYMSELRGGAQATTVGRLRALVREGRVTLLTATRDLEKSAARMLADALVQPHTPRR